MVNPRPGFQRDRPVVVRRRTAARSSSTPPPPTPSSSGAPPPSLIWPNAHWTKAWRRCPPSGKFPPRLRLLTATCMNYRFSCPATLLPGGVGAVPPTNRNLTQKVRVNPPRRGISDPSPTLLPNLEEGGGGAIKYPTNYSASSSLQCSKVQVFFMYGQTARNRVFYLPFKLCFS